MNRFFAGLLERADGRAPVLQRRPRALFEPRAESDARQTTVLEQDEVHQVTPEVTHAPVAEVPAVSTVRGPSRPRNEEHEESPHLHRAVSPKRASEREDRPSLQREALAQADVPAGRTRPQPEPPLAPVGRTTIAKPDAIGGEARSTISQIVEVRRVTERVVSHAEAEVAPSARAVPERRSPDVPPPVKTPTAAVEHPRVMPPPSKRVTPVVSESAVRLAKAQSATVVRRERPLASPAAPVQITIGRVEVRAVSARTERRPAAPTPAAPRLSLDDYLRQRSGEAR